MILKIISRMFGWLKRNIKKGYREKKLKVQWRIQNNHNQTHVGKYWFDKCRVSVGIGTYGYINIINNSDCELKIGNFCSIADNAVMLLGAEHYINTLSTFPFKVRYIKTLKIESITKGNIIIDDDVWIGYGATILSGVHIRQGAVVAAGATVVHDVPPYAIVGGVPAKIIKYRYAPLIIEYMLTLDYSKLTEDLIRTHVDDLYTKIDDMELEEIKKLFSWFPKKEGDENLRSDHVTHQLRR